MFFLNFRVSVSLLTVYSFFLVRDVPQEIFSVRFSFDGTLLATGCNDGVVRIYNGKTGGNVLQTLRPTTEDGGPPQGSEELSVQLPITAMRFRPGGNSRGVLLACSADATVRHWHVPTGKCLSTIYEGNDQQIFACDYRQDGQMFATGGKDKRLRLYDESRTSSSTGSCSGIGASATLSNSRGSSSSTSPSGASPISTFGGGLFAGASIETLSGHSSSQNSDTCSGGSHSNRIFAVCFHPLEKDLILSGGWDNTIQIWDARVSGNGHGAVRSMFGAHLCGDALQVTPDGNYVISGSWRPEDALQIWDFRSGKLISSIPFLRSNTDVKPYLNAVAKVRNFNRPIEAFNSEDDQSQTPLLKNSPAPPSLPSRTRAFHSNTSVTSPPIQSTSIIPEYEKPDPTLLYSISFSKMVSSSHGEGTSHGHYVFAGGSGVNGGKVFKTQDLLSFASDIYSTRTGESLSIMKDDMTGKDQRAETIPSYNKNATPIIARTCRPLIASISGLARGVFASDWDGNSGLVIVGGDQPIRVFDVNDTSVANDTVGTGGGIKRKAGGRVGAILAVTTELRDFKTENDSALSGVLSSNSTNSIVPKFGSSDAAILTQESFIPPIAPTTTLRPPPAVLLALAAANAISREEAEDAHESSLTELTEAEVNTARKAISAAALYQETEMGLALERNTVTAWEADVDDSEVRQLTAIDDAFLEDQEATFDAGYRKVIGSSGFVVQIPSPSTVLLIEEPVDGRMRRSSGAVDALRALIEGARINSGEQVE